MTSFIQLHGVTHYYGQVCALKNVDLDLEPGTIGLVGQNGAGKSTLLQILLGLMQPTSGAVRLFGQDVGRSGIVVRQRIGYMPERSALVPGLNGVEYVALAGELCGMSRKQALRRAHETLSYLGLEEVRYRKLEQYSAGIQQRLKLAATLVHDPDLLLLDEPTAGLDPDGRNSMLSLIRSLASRPNKSLLLCSHLLGDIERVCERAVILDAGGVIGVGRIADLRSTRPSCYTIRWKGDAGQFLHSLRSKGTKLTANGRNTARATVPGGWSTRAFFELAQQHDLLLTGLEPEEENLEAVYHRLIAKQESEKPIGEDHQGVVKK